LTNGPWAYPIGKKPAVRKERRSRGAPQNLRAAGLLRAQCGRWLL